MENTFLETVETELTQLLCKKAAQLPKNFQQTKFIQNCIAALENIEDIEQVEAISVAKGLMKGAILGLDFLNRECYLIPYKNKDTGKKDVNFQTDYKGEKKLAKLYTVNPIEEITTELVREGDFYEYEVRNNKKLVNWKPKRFNTAQIEGAFSLVLFKDGSSVSAEMSLQEMEEVRKLYSKAKDSPAWKNRPGEMYKKTVLRSCLKNVEKVFESPEQLRAYEDASDFDFTNQAVYAEAPVVRNVFAEQQQVHQIETGIIETIPTEINNSATEAQPVFVEAGANKTETKNPSADDEFYCVDCGKKISWAENTYSTKNFKKPLCRSCRDIIRGEQ